MDTLVTIGSITLLGVALVLLLPYLLQSRIEPMLDHLANRLNKEIALSFENRAAQNSLDFDKVIAIFVSMSDKAKATFLYRIVEALDQDHISTIESYISLKKRKKMDNERTREHTKSV